MNDILTSADQAAREFLLDRIDYERVTPPAGDGTFPLERMHTLLRLIGQPHDGQRIVHITGTKGKGSTAAMVAAMLTAAGYRTGLFTSPHLERLEERLAIDGEPCRPDQLTRLLDALREPVAQMDRASRVEAAGPTFFEITTAAAFLHFAQEKCDATVLEVGLGGRLDSTNVCQPLVSVITSISLDHVRQLGSTTAAIAREKAGIIKPGIPAVSGVRENEPRRVIESVARERRAPLWTLGDHFGFTPRRWNPTERVESAENAAKNGSGWGLDYWESRNDLGFTRSGVHLAMAGRHQAHNAAVAMAAIGFLAPHSFQISEAAIREGLSSARLPARAEILSRDPPIVRDAAHNLASIDALLAVLDDEFPGQPRTYLFAASRDKDVEGMLRLLLPTCRRLVLTRYATNPRAVPTEELQAIVRQILAEQPAHDPEKRFSRPQWHVEPDPSTAWNWALAGRLPREILCATGSFFLAAELPLHRGVSHL